MPTKERKGSEKWQIEVGRLMISFGDIEYVTYLCLLFLPSENIIKSTQNLRFQQRVDLVLDILRGKKINENIKAKFIENFTKAKKLAEQRNLVAHNPLMIGVYTDEEGKLKFRPELTVFKKRDKKVLFEELKETANEAESLAKTLLFDFQDLEQELNHNSA